MGLSRAQRDGLAVENLRVAYPDGTEAVRGFSLHAEPGELVVLAGGTGCGKSTVLAACSGVIPGTFPARVSGRVRVAGIDPWTAGPAHTARAAAHLFQNVETQLFTDRVLDEAMLQAEFGPIDVPDPEAAARQELDRFHLLERAPDRVDTLSSGLKQRLSLAAMHLDRKRVLLLDEPLAYLDPASARGLAETLARLSRSGLAVVVAEHRLEILAPVADRIVRMDPDRDTDTKTRPRRTAGHEAARAEGLCFSFPGRPVLRGVDITLQQGRCLLLAGPNGSGKTTLCHLLAGVLRPESGHVLLGEAAPCALPPAERAARVAMLVQNPDRQLFASSLEAEVGPDGADLLESLGLAGMRKRHPRSLSYGQKRRLTLARALAKRPDILLVDEPSVGQDAGHLGSLLAVLETHLERGGALLLATHDRRLAPFADELLFLDNGRVRSTGAAGAFDATGPVVHQPPCREVRS